jgi:molybdenum cofactor cytidylyltransferase
VTSAVVGPVAGVLLAAGTSSRMGRNKLLLELGGESVLRGAARRAVDAGLSPVVVVLGAEAESTRQELYGLPCDVVVNPDFADGITASVRAGVSSLAANVPAAMILLADMPLVTTDMIRGMIARYRTTRAPLVISDYDGVTAPPALYDRRLFGELQAMTPKRCSKQVIARYRDEAEVLCWPVSALADLDVLDDYALILKEHGVAE